MKLSKTAVIAALFTALFFSCNRESGTLEFRANGEEFVRDGFTTKDGWAITFDEVLVNVSNPTAYNAATNLKPVVLEGSHLIDLTGGSREDPSVFAGQVEKVQPGNYQSLHFTLKQLESGEHSGASIILQGKASQNDQTIPFLIRLNEELTYDGKEGFVGDSIKGLLDTKGTCDVEMTFHFDHIFGDFEAAADEHVNDGTPGFNLFLEFAKAGRIEVSQEELKTSPNYPSLLKSFESLGHLGEGHCDVIK